ncbi:hypothetical protein F4813DRAFT_393637 [Daldinia decipiens]|uniref:uncharacterized protein n=1 Tax=Daldinia decipiens TaxID=326647 RepID=UPI0020C4AB2F|nr:uncharacterized protein F4813DRAFT_393637 [Daldinia decipiens]KAI1653454.1 hypothetical protein F4813DRAFT_393637 [Daldinia decipiens]
MADSSDGKTRKDGMVALALHHSDDASSIDLLKHDEIDNPTDQAGTSTTQPFRVPALPSLGHPSLLQHPSSRKREHSRVDTLLKAPQKKPRHWKSRQPGSIMDSSSGLPTQDTQPSQGQEASQSPSDSIRKLQPQPDNSTYTELCFEVDSSTQSTSTSNDFEETGGENKPASGSHMLTESEVASLPYGLGLIYAETCRLKAESKRRKEEMEAEQAAEKARLAAVKKANEFRWPGDTSAYTAESFVFLNPPGSELRAKAIHIGIPKSQPLTSRVSAYAVRQEGSADIEFRMARDGSTPEEIRQGPLVDYKQIRLNDFFKGMKQNQADLWARQLLAQVPGINDAIVKWK